jgi:large subunit ribosomal protein L1
MKGGERVVSVGPSEEELAALEVAEVKAEEAPKEEKKHKRVKEQKAFHSEKYEKLLEEVNRTKNYVLSEALELLGNLQRKSFDETVELHINTITTGISGQITLPHGTGKTTRVAIADDKLIAEVEKGIINFDVLVAEPAMMAKLAKVAKVLGPRGLMPNPKNGTITPKPEEVAKKYAGGQINFKTEAKAPIIHLTVGKVSFGPAKLTDNIEALIAAIKKPNIVNVTLKSTMSPGLKLKI